MKRPQLKGIQLKQLKWDIILIFFIGFFLRLFYIGNIPGNTALYADESFSAYNAWSMLHYGMDSSGYVRPVYLEVWGTGMSVMQALCQIPFIAVFGATSFAARLPRAILGCLQLVAFYEFCKIGGRGEKFAKTAAFVLAVMPWDIMMSRFALDCNYLPPFLMFGLLFLVKTKENSKYFMLSMLFYGLSLYCYALPWTVMPIVVCGGIVWMLFVMKIRINKFVVAGGVIFTILAIPLLLFLAVNFGLMEPMMAGIVTIPRLAGFRNEELILSPKGYISNLYKSLLLFLEQNDGRVSDVTPLFGLFYKFSYPLMAVGFGLSIFRMHKEEKCRSDGYVWLQFLAGVVLCGMIETFFSRVNIILLPMTYFLCVGCHELVERFGEGAKYTIAFVYLASCMAFTGYYYVDHDEEAFLAYGGGKLYVMDYIEEQAALKGDDDYVIHVMSGFDFPSILYYEQIPTDEYLEKTLWDEKRRAEGDIRPLRFRNIDYSCSANQTLPEIILGDYYVLDITRTEHLQYLRDHGIEPVFFSGVAVGYVPE